MIRHILAAVALAIAVSTAAEAGTMPRTFEATPAAVERLCRSFGENRSATAWDFKPGEYGCADAKHGHVIVCKAAGTCTFYYGPRRLPAQRAGVA